MTHYHVKMGALNTPPLMNMQFENYEDSIRHFAKLSYKMFGHYSTAESLSVVNAYKATGFGMNDQSVVGGIQVIDQNNNIITNIGLAVYWQKCEGCFNALLN